MNNFFWKAWAVVLVLSLFWLGWCIKTSAPARAQSPDVPDVIRAKAFLLVDDEGTTRGSLSVDVDGTAGVRFFDAQGKARAVLDVDASGTPYLGLLDAQGEPRAGIAAHSDGTSYLILCDAQGRVLFSAP